MPSFERLVWSAPSHGVITFGDALVQIWERDAPAAAFRSILSDLEERGRLTPDRSLWMLAISGEGSSMPDAEARKISARFPEFFSAFALVIEGTGFRASAARGVMASMSMMSSKRTRPHIASTVKEGCDALAALSHGAFDAAEALRTIVEARASLRG